MAEQNAGEQGSTEQRTGRHAVPDDAPDTTTNATTDATTDATTTDATTTDGATTDGAATDAATTHGAATDGETTSAATTTDGPAEAPTQQVEAPTQQVPSQGQEQPTSQVSPAGQAEPTRQMERPQGPPPAAAPARAGRGDGARSAVRRVTGFLATFLRIVGLVLALVLVAFVVMTLVGVNPENGVAQLVTAGADALVLRFRDLFLPADPGLALIVNYGVAALFWLVVGLVAARIVRALGRLV